MIKQNICAMDLKLVLKKKWYDMIESGVKLEEYRDIKPHWTTRLVESIVDTPKFKNIKTVTFYLGYAKNRPKMQFKVVGVCVGAGVPEWGAEIGKNYYVIKLGERLQ